MSNVPDPIGGALPAIPPADDLAESLDLIERWIADEWAEGNPGTVRKRRKALATFVHRLDGRPLTAATVADVELWLSTVSPGTSETYTAVLRSFYGWAVDRQLIAPVADPSPKRLVKPVEPLFCQGRPVAVGGVGQCCGREALRPQH